jgi:hypothetical protein
MPRAVKPRKAAAPRTQKTVEQKTVATASVRELSYDEIAREAFVRWIDRGCEHGHDVQDWVAAEASLRQTRAA